MIRPDLPGNISTNVSTARTLEELIKKMDSLSCVVVCVGAAVGNWVA